VYYFCMGEVEERNELWFSCECAGLLVTEVWKIVDLAKYFVRSYLCITF